MAEQIEVPLSIYRGGTSKGVLVHERHLPPPGTERERVIRALMGSPDPRQIDGLGGADVLTSKVGIMAPATVPDADIDYTFVQVGVESTMLGYDINCGNISSAAALFAIDERFVTAQGSRAIVRIHNTNTRSVLVADVPLVDGEPRVHGDFAIDGVPGTGAEIRMDYSRAAGGTTGAILPTGNAVDEIALPGTSRKARVSVVDVANICAFVDAGDVGISGTELPDEITDEAYETLAAIKATIADRLGIPRTNYGPMIVSVAPPSSHPIRDGSMLSSEAMDVTVRRIRTPQSNFPVGSVAKAYPGTVGICTAVARCIPGSVVWQNAGPALPGLQVVRLGHPSGVMPVSVDVGRNEDGSPRLGFAGFSRTARLIMKGSARIPARAHADA